MIKRTFNIGKAKRTHPTLRIAAIVFLIGGLVGCSYPAAGNSQWSEYQEFRQCVKSHQYHQGLLILKQITPELEKMPNNAAAFEYALIMDAAAQNGQDEWAAILQDPDISLSWKRDLTERIDFAVHGDLAARRANR